ncbi:MAG: 3-hydroxyacyl-CoA dehydrogenase [Alphaproteobacteria bacterium HGW-Alphaproteobacteria-6]|nr:MAG: 3-hydroxyacyl-CoA dehydrogenase [Alphaproteobacteria bacterium HGW-Alphaproteobacteria-6]
MAKDSIAVVGAGMVGRGWAISFARAGYAVRLFDAKPSALDVALAEIGAMVADLHAHDLLNKQDPSDVMARIHATPDLARALDGVTHVQECTPEQVEAKREVFAELDALAGDGVVLASSSSAILPSRFTEGLPGRHRCLVAHPINPPYLVPAVEIVPAAWTSAEAVARTSALLRDCGQSPIVMKKEAEGFVMNCLQGALLNEAFRLVAEGYASADDVDTGVRDGLGLRWSFMGPFETIDLNAPGGIRDYVARYGPAYERIAEDQHPVPWRGTLVDDLENDRAAVLPRDQLAERQRWRDRKLMALTAHKRAEGAA